MIDAPLVLAPDRAVAPPWPQRFATLGVFLANGLGIGCWAAAIPRVKADLALSDATLSVALLAFAAGAIIVDAAHGSFRPSFAQWTGVGHRRFRFRGRSCRPWLCPVARDLVRRDVPRGSDPWGDGHRDERQRERHRTKLGEADHVLLSCWIQPGRRSGRSVGRVARGVRNALGLLGPALLASLVVAVSAPILAGEGSGFRRALVCGAQPAPLAARRAGVRIDVDRRRGRRLERNLSRALGCGAGLRGSRLRGLFAPDDHRQDRRRSESSPLRDRA